MKVVILQPSYIPWRGYFHQILQADLFIFYDDVKFDKNGWRNRNRIKTPQGLKWLTIPVHQKGIERYHTPINQVEINWDRDWITSHWNTIEMSYHKAPFFDDFSSELSPFYKQKPIRLAEFTIDLTIKIAELLDIKSPDFLCSSELKEIHGEKTERLIQILKYVGANRYLSGPSARSYLDEDMFKKAGIQLEYMVYDYPEYPQFYPPFEGQVSILDLLFMVGCNALDFIHNVNE
jgi:hypothetical protein